MPLYDSNVSQTDNFGAERLAKRDEQYIYFSDGGFYPYLKYLINKSTGIPNGSIYLSGYGENNPFLQQDKAPKVFLELFMYRSPCMSGYFDGYGDTHIFMQTKYRVYFVNDNYRAPFLFEAALKASSGKLDEISKKFAEYVKQYKDKLFMPSQISMGSNKTHKEFSFYPIISYDVFMSGAITHNIKELENVPFDDIDNGVILQ